METDSKYLEFDKVGDTGITKIYNVLSKSNGFILGRIKWHGPWRQYCFLPSPHTIFDTACMFDISKCINELMAERRK